MEKIGLNELASVMTLTALQTDELMQLISFGATLLVAITTLILNIVRAVSIAKSDGKITTEEVVAIVDEVKNGIDDVKTIINKGEEDVK